MKYEDFRPSRVAFVEPDPWRPPPRTDVEGLSETQARLVQAAAVVKLRVSFELWKRGINETR